MGLLEIKQFRRTGRTREKSGIISLTLFTSKLLLKTKPSLHCGKCWFEWKPKCINCGKFGHMPRDCNRKKRNTEVELCQSTWGYWNTFLCLQCCDWDKSEHLLVHWHWVWQPYDKRWSLLINVKRNLTSKVKMGIGDIVKVARRGTLLIETKLHKKNTFKKWCLFLD